MVQALPLDQPTPTVRRRGRPPGTTNAARAARLAAAETAAFSGSSPASSEPPPKKRRYIPGGPGGGGRFVDHPATPDTSSDSALSGRERSTRRRAAASEDGEQIHWGSAAAMAAFVKQAEDYKPREERGWEEFHPNLDIERSFLVFSAEDVDGAPQCNPSTPVMQTPGTPLVNGSITPSRHVKAASTGNTPNPQKKNDASAAAADDLSGTPSRRPRRQARDVVNFYGTRSAELSLAPKTPKILAIQNRTTKERLDLKLPSYRKTSRIELFESKTFGQARYVDKSMSNVGYQESDHFIRPDTILIKAMDGNVDEDADQSPASKAEDHPPHYRPGRVEYDMDEQDDMWLEQYNAQRKQNELELITREAFEITMTKIEKEWHALEKRIPKPNPKPPQTHRPRSSSAAAVNGEPQAGEEPDSKCAVCDDGDCENTNAIVFCDGCNLAVHQECYGVPFIPEGQWLCRKCQLCGRGVPTCLFCPNTDGAFKQTNSSKWAHLLCAMWIPEVSLGNHTFMEPVMDVNKVPKTRWKLSCYICHQRMGACIQCGNRNCYQAFHVTCARRARLFLKMKTSQGALAVLDGGMVLKAFCDKHCPLEYAEENGVHQATRAAKKFYRRNMRGRIWADSLAMASVIAAQHRNTIAEYPPDESQVVGVKNGTAPGDKKKGSQPPRSLWKLPSGAPIIPQAVFDVVEASTRRFPFSKKKEFLSEACRYWTLKREARRGAALLKRLQLQMETFSSMELTRRNFASMGPGGKARLARRIEFAESIIQDLEQLRSLSEDVVQREQMKVDAVELEQDFVDECYFPIAKLLAQPLETATLRDKNVFSEGLAKLRKRVEERFHVTVMSFARDLREIIIEGVTTAPKAEEVPEQRFEAASLAPPKNIFSDIRERRRLGKRIFKAVQAYLEAALRYEAEMSNKPYESLQRQLEHLIDANIEAAPATTGAGLGRQDGDKDTIMVDAPASDETTGQNGSRGNDVTTVDDDVMKTAEDCETEDGGNIEVNTSGLGIINHGASDRMGVSSHRNKGGATANGDDTSQTPPDSQGFAPTAGPDETGPLTPPQSNGSFGRESGDSLAEGGVLSHLRAMKPVGTSILSEHWAAGRDAVRMLSEDLTDLDDEELRGLGADVDDAVTAAALLDTKATATAAESTASTSKCKANTKARKRRASGRRR